METATVTTPQPRTSRLHTDIVLLANAYIELCCIDPWLPELKRHWVLRRTVDYSRICLQ